MSKFKRLIRGLLALLLFISLIGLAESYSAKQVLAKPDKVSSLLDQTSLYDSFIGQVTSEARQSLGNIPNSSGLNTAIRQTAESTLTKDQFNRYLSSIVTSNYSWLEGHSSQPNFKINLTSIKQSFSLQIKTYTQADLSSLPSCSLSQALDLIKANADPLSFTCKPAGLDTANVAQQVANKVDLGDAFLANPVITARTINAYNNNTGTPYYKTYHKAPKYYQWLMKLPVFSTILILVSATAITILSESKKRAMRIISYVFFGSGILLIASYFATNRISEHINRAINKKSDLIFLKPGIINFTDKIDASLFKTGLIFGIAYLIVALIIIFLSIFSINRRTYHKRSKKDSHTAKQSLPTNSDYLRAIKIKDNHQSASTSFTGKSPNNHRNQNVKTAPILERTPKHRNKLIQ